MDQIHYPHNTIRTEHQSIAIGTANKFTIASKIFFKKNRKVGLLLQEGIDELALAAILDTYSRTFPLSNSTLLASGSSVHSKYGLTLFPTASIDTLKLDELHVTLPDSYSNSDEDILHHPILVTYRLRQSQYIIDTCLKRISQQYGTKFSNISKLLLDYNE